MATVLLEHIRRVNAFLLFCNNVSAKVINNEKEEKNVQDIVDRLRLAGDNAAALLRLDDEAARNALAPKPQ